MRKLYYLLAFLLFVAAPTGHARSEISDRQELRQYDEASADSVPSVDNLLILKIELPPYVLAEAMPAYFNYGSVVLPLAELSATLDFPIDVDVEGRRANGWFLRENQLFSLDVNNGEVVIAGKRAQFNRSLVSVVDEDIYVDVRLLAKWFPLDIQFDLANLIVSLESREPLPVEQILARNERRERLMSGRRKARTYAEMDHPYQMLSWPMTDTSLEYSFQRSGTNTTQGLVQNTTATADVANMNAEFFIASTDQDKLTQARLKLGRKDVKGDLLGPAKASEIAFGDIFTPQVPLISSTKLGRGATISNFPVDQPTEFDRITLNGDLPVGWEVELHRNEVLLDFQTSRSDGRYVFEDVPLLFGVNVLRLVFYGPQGQVREKVEQIRVGPDQVKPSEFHYRISANQQERQLLLGDVDDVSDAEFQGKSRYFAEFETGLTRNISLAGNLVSIPSQGGHNIYAGLGARAVLGDIFGRLDLVRDLSEGVAVKVAAQTSIAGFNVTIEHDRLYDFVSEQFTESSDPLTHQTDFRLDGNFPILDITHIPFSVTANHIQQESGDTATNISNRMSAALGPASVTHSLNYQLDKAEGSRSTGVDGSLLVGGRVADVKIRGQLNYGIAPLGGLTNSSVNADWRINAVYGAEAGISKDLTEDGLTAYTAGINGVLGPVALGLNLEYDSAEEFNARMTMSFSTARDPQSGEFGVYSARLAESAAMTTRVFLDQNFNGVFDDGDEPLEGVGFNANGTELQASTGENGMAFVTGIDTYKPVQFEIATATLEDPYWVAQPSGVSVVLRPGTTGHVDFPIVTSGEVDGIVYMQSGDWAREVSEAVVQLVDEEGHVVKETKSAFDGFYLLGSVLPGTYSLRIDPEQVKRIKVAQPPIREIKINGEGTILSGMDFVLASKSSEIKTLRMLLTSFATAEDANAAWASLLEVIAGDLEGLSPAIEKQELSADKLTIHNLYASGLESRDAAARLCRKVQRLKSQLWCNPMTVQVR